MQARTNKERLEAIIQGNMPSAKTKSSLIPNLDLLRACAVLFVLADHTLFSLGVRRIWASDMEWLGRLGVLFFFVHTCCVLMSSLERHKGQGLVWRFFVRRAFRIYPFSIVAVLLAMIPPHAPALRAAQWLSNLALIQNLTFSPDAFGTLWSLPLEVQMYFFLPFIFLWMRRSKRRWPLLGLFVISIPVALWQPHHVARATVLAFVAAFLPGVIAYWLFRKRLQRLPGWGVPILIGLIAVAFLVHPGWSFPAWIACLALGVAIPLFRQISSPAVNRVTFHLAKYSYGIYLSHSLLLTWMPPTWRNLPLYLLLVAAASITAYHAVEYPLIRLGQHFTRDLASVPPMAAHAEVPGA
jgi:peptidoglycan/LPS O-acetylase OafA/YrhL